MSSSLDRSQLRTRDHHIRRAHSLLESYGIEWSPSKVATIVKHYLAGTQRESLEQIVAKAISKKLNRTSTDPKCITYADPTGEEAAHRADHPHPERHVMPRYGTIKEFAQQCNISQTTVRRYIAEGRLTAHRVGPRLIRIDMEQAQRELFGDNGTAA